MRRSSRRSWRRSALATEFLAAGSLDEALEALADPDAVPVSGAVAIGLLLRHRLLAPSRLVWLGRLGELRGVARTSGGGVRIGALTTLAELAAAPGAVAEHPVVPAAAARIGNVRVRAVATLGGHCVNADPRQDLPPVLVALDATMVARGPAGERLIAAQDFFTGHLETALQPGELLVAVELPAAEPRRRSVHLRFNPASEDDYPTVAVAATRLGDRLRIAVGGVADRPLLVADLGELDAATPAGDHRGSSGYKRAMARLFVRRAVEALA